VGDIKQMLDSFFDGGRSIMIDDAATPVFVIERIRSQDEDVVILKELLDPLTTHRWMHPNAQDSYEFKRSVCWNGHHFLLRDDSEDLIVGIFSHLSPSRKTNQDFAVAECIGPCTCLIRSAEVVELRVFPAWSRRALAMALEVYQSLQLPKTVALAKVELEASVVVSKEDERFLLAFKENERLRKVVYLQRIGWIATTVSGVIVFLWGLFR